MSLFPQNDPAQASLQAVPQGLPFQDPKFFNPNPEGILDAATALGRLPQVSQQLALEKAQRKAELANVDYRMQVLSHLQENLPLAAAADAAGYTAKSAEANAASSSAALTQSTNQALLAGGLPLANAATQIQIAKNAEATAKANAAFAALPPLQQKALLENETAKAQFYGGFGASIPGASTAGTGATDTGADIPVDELREAKFADALTTPVETSEYDPETGVTTQKVVRVAKDGSGIVSETPTGVLRTDATKTNSAIARDLSNIATTQNFVSNVKNALETWEKTYPNAKGFAHTLQQMGQAVGANAASRPLDPSKDGAVSVIKRSIGSLTETPETKNLVATLQNLGQSLSRLDGESQKTLSGIIPTVADLANPDQLKVKLQGTEDYLQGRVKSYKDTGVGARQTKAAMAAAEGAPKTVAVKPATPRSAIPDGARAFINGVPMQRVTINGVTGWMPVVQDTK